MEAGLSDERLRAGMPVNDELKRRVRKAYRHEVAYTDRHLMRLLDALESKGVFSTGLVILTADHGEEFWDHGFTGHGHQHHTEVVDVALAMVGVGVTGGLRTDEASLLDVVPTLRAVAGLEPNGVDLRRPIEEERVVSAYGNAYFEPDRSAKRGSVRAVVRGHDAAERVCFNLSVDPYEQSPSPCDPEDPVLEAALAANPAPEAEGAVLDAAALEAMGYVVPDE